MAVTGFPEFALADNEIGTLVVCVTSDAVAELPHFAFKAERIAEQNAEIEALLASTSWRVTAPMRSIVWGLRGY
jgi:hypothetical protein